MPAGTMLPQCLSTKHFLQAVSKSKKTEIALFSFKHKKISLHFFIIHANYGLNVDEIQRCCITSSIENAIN